MKELAFFVGGIIGLMTTIYLFLCVLIRRFDQEQFPDLDDVNVDDLDTH